MSPALMMGWTMIVWPSPEQSAASEESFAHEATQVISWKVTAMASKDWEFQSTHNPSRVGRKDAHGASKPCS